MADREKLLTSIQACTDPKALRQWLKNLKGRDPELEAAAFRRLVCILPKEEPGTVAHDFWQMVHAFEQVLSDERGKVTRLGRTRQKVQRVGEVQTLKDWALASGTTEGFDMLIERQMPEYTGEAIVLRHADKFEEDVVVAARHRLVSAGVDIDGLGR